MQLTKPVKTFDRNGGLLLLWNVRFFIAFTTTKASYLCLILFVASLSSQAQSIYPSTINTSGNFTSSGEYQFEWSVGESASIVTMTSPNLVVTSGVLQSVTPYTSANNSSINWLDGEIKIYPNPTKDIIEIKMLSNTRGKNTLRIFDLMGRKMMEKQFDHYGAGTVEKWDLSRLMAGQYLLHVELFDPLTGKTVKKGAFKILKIK